MNILVLGSGGREHTLVWKIKQSPLVDKIWAIPGNDGIAQIAECVDMEITDFPKLINFIKKESINLTVVGPEAPLVNGIVDYFQQEKVAIFGPEQNASQLEGSKIFAKNLMKKYSIPTADFKIFSESREAKKYIHQLSSSLALKKFPLVIKADGLAGGKGVIVCHNSAEAIEAIGSIMEEKILGEAGNQILIEDFLIGEEASILAFCDGKTILPMLCSQDHKQIFDEDKGPNTGGMGAYAPASVVTEELLCKINSRILLPLKNGLQNENIKYKGVIYVGIMIVKNEPFVLEFNVRFGDPETQVILPLLKSDLVPILSAVVNEQLQNIQLEWYNKYAVCVVLASGGYPGKYEKNKVIYGLQIANKMRDIIIFHAGTKISASAVSNLTQKRKHIQYITSGGRVLGVTGIGNSLNEAIAKAYRVSEKIIFEKRHYRKDIGRKGLIIRNP